MLWNKFSRNHFLRRQMQKEAVVIILDVGQSMAGDEEEEGEGHISPLAGAVKAVSLLIQQKMLFGQRDEIGLVLFGTSGGFTGHWLQLLTLFEETMNPLSEDGYQHISVVRDISFPDLELLKYVSTIKSEGAQGDCMHIIICYFFRILIINPFFLVIDALIVGMGERNCLLPGPALICPF